VTNKEREKLIVALLKSEEIKAIYKDYIIKEIPFETWVRDMAGHLLKGMVPKKAAHKECIGCNCADNSISYSDWWYCTNPKNFRDFTVLRSNCNKPKWCQRG
jgi:hypothetical protein